MVSRTIPTAAITDFLTNTIYYTNDTHLYHKSRRKTLDFLRRVRYNIVRSLEISNVFSGC